MRGCPGQPVHPHGLLPSLPQTVGPPAAPSVEEASSAEVRSSFHRPFTAQAAPGMCNQHPTAQLD